jgi:hypothetical protein
MANIFNKQLKSNKGGFSIDSAQLTFTALSDLSTGSLLVQGVQIQYQQQVNFIYDLNDHKGVYYVAGRADGNLNLNKVVGSGGIVKDFYAKYGNVCGIAGQDANTIELSFDTNCAGGSSQGNGKVTIRNPLIVSFGLQMQVDQGVVSENVAMRFSDLDIN